jgi:hypothetical protein
MSCAILSWADAGRLILSSTLERVGEALATLYGAAKIAMFGVADQSLLTQPGLFLDHRERHILRGWAESGLILTAGKADVPLLQIAGETGLSIITSDRFGGHRREFPWLDGSDDCVLEPRTGRHGRVYLERVTLTRRTEWEMSMSEERDLLVQQGLSRHVEVLGRYWSCLEPRCPRNDPMNSPYVLLPLAIGGRLVCDQHHLDMIDKGPRPRVAQLKIMQNGREQRRFTVTQNEPPIVGRSPGPTDLSSFLDEIARRRVSRAHLRFDLDSERLTVTDVSRNGTTLIVRNGTRFCLHQATRPFSVGDQAQIHPSLEIIRSGRRYPSELSGRRGTPRQPPDEAQGSPSRSGTRPEHQGYGSLETRRIVSPPGMAGSSGGDSGLSVSICGRRSRRRLRVCSSKLGRVTEPRRYATQASCQESGLSSNNRTALSSAGVGGGPLPIRICSMVVLLRSRPGVAVGCGNAAFRNWWRA